MRKLPPLHALRAFEAAARHRHFAHAAEELGLTPTAISHQVRLLEQILGVVLFIRHPRPVRLTREGQALFAAMQDALDRIAGGVAGLQKPDPDAPLHLSVTHAFASRWLMPRLPRLRHETGCAINVEADDRVADLHASGIDMAIRYAASAGPDGEWHPLFADRVVPMAVPDVAGAAAALSPHQILALPRLHYRWTTTSDHMPDWDRWQAVSGYAGPALGPVQTFSTEILALDAAMAGQGVVLASERLAEAPLHSGALVRLSGIALPGLTYWAVLLPSHPRRADLLALIEWMAGQACIDAGQGLSVWR